MPPGAAAKQPTDGARDRIAFVHIPKTGGCSIIHAFEHALGASNCVSFAPAIDDGSFASARFVSGHVQLSMITPRAFAFTFLRNPLHQIAGHLAWLDRYNHPVFWEELAALPADIQTIVDRVGATDFDSAASLEAFFRWLPDDSGARLLNVQCEVLAARADRLAYHTQEEMARVAIANLARLDFIGITERIPTDLPRLFRRLGLRTKPVVTMQNTLSSPRRIDPSNLAVTAVLLRAVAADMSLYHHAARRSWDGIVGRISAHLRLHA